MGKPRQNEYISHGNQIIPHVNIFMRIGNKFTPTLCWNLHKPKPPKIETFFNGERILNNYFHTPNGLKAIDWNMQKYKIIPIGR